MTVTNTDRCQNCKKLLSLLNSLASICAEYEISSKLKPLSFFVQNYDLKDGRCQHWQVSESQKTIVINEFSTFKLFTMQNFVWKMVNLIPRSPFPFLKIADSVECISNLTLNSQKIIDYKRTLKATRYDNLNELIFAHLNINLIKNNFEELISHVKGAVDVLMISETKIDDSFPIANFLIDGFSQPYKKNRNFSGGGIMLYGR